MLRGERKMKRIVGCPMGTRFGGPERVNSNVAHVKPCDSAGVDPEFEAGRSPGRYVEEEIENSA